MAWIYGVLGSENNHIDTSHSERGAKVKAGRDGYSYVSRRHDVSWAVEVVAINTEKGWLPFDVVKSDTMCFLQSVDHSRLIDFADEVGAESCSPTPEEVFDLLYENHKLASFYLDEVKF